MWNNGIVCVCVCMREGSQHRQCFAVGRRPGLGGHRRHRHEQRTTARLRRRWCVGQRILGRFWRCGDYHRQCDERGTEETRATNDRRSTRQRCVGGASNFVHHQSATGACSRPRDQWCFRPLELELKFEIRWNSGGAGDAVKVPGHFEVRKSSSPVRSPSSPGRREGSPVLNGLMDLLCICCTGCTTKS